MKPSQPPLDETWQPPAQQDVPAASQARRGRQASATPPVAAPPGPRSPTAGGTTGPRRGTRPSTLAPVDGTFAGRTRKMVGQGANGSARRRTAVSEAEIASRPATGRSAAGRKDDLPTTKEGVAAYRIKRIFDLRQAHLHLRRETLKDSSMMTRWIIMRTLPFGFAASAAVLYSPGKAVAGIVGISGLLFVALTASRAKLPNLVTWWQAIRLPKKAAPNGDEVALSDSHKEISEVNGENPENEC